MVLPGDGHDRMLDLIPEPRREILRILKRDGPLPAAAVADVLDITVSGARQHLAGLHREGVVTYTKHREGPGRPLHLYELTDEGDALFPRRQGDLASELLGYVMEEDPELVERIFRRRCERRVCEARDRLREVDDPRSRVDALADFLEEEGYMASVEEADDATLRLTERNCLVQGLSECCAGGCEVELEFRRRVLPDAEVRRVAHAADGDPCCAYLVRPPSPEQDVGPGVDR